MKNLVSLLKAILPLPPAPLRLSSTMTNSGYGGELELPRDYLEFLTVFGNGTIKSDRDAWTIDDLVSDSQVRRSMNLLAAGRDRPVVFKGLKMLAFPYGTDLIPWGNDDQGDTFYWLTKGVPDEWPVLIGRFDLTDTQVSFSQFLYDSITGRGKYYGFVAPAWPTPILFRSFAEYDRQMERKT